MSRKAERRGRYRFDEDDPEVKLQPDLADLDGDERELCESNYEVNKVRIKAEVRYTGLFRPSWSFQAIESSPWLEMTRISLALQMTYRL